MSVASPSRAAFPVSQAGRHPRLHFRGLLRLHSNYGPLDRSTAQGGLCHRASIHPVTRINRLPATRSNRQLSGWFLPPLVIRAFWAHCDLRVRYPYFHKPAPLRFNEATDYGDAEHTMIHVESYEWMHGPLEVCDALIRAGLALKRLEEFEFLPWNHLPAMWEDEDRLWRLAGGPAANTAFLCDCGPQAVVRDGVCMSPGLC